MSEFIKIILSLSVSGTLWVLLILSLKPLYKNKFSKRWQYYIWMIAALKFLLPFSFGTVNVGSLLAGLHVPVMANKGPDMSVPAHADSNGITQIPTHADSDGITQTPTYADSDGTTQAPIRADSDETVQPLPSASSNKITRTPAYTNPSEIERPPVQTVENAAAASTHNLPGIGFYLFFVWLALALIFFVRKITTYQGFIRYLKASNLEVSDIKTLNILSDCKEKLKINTRVELYRNASVASPIMTGFFRPSIILPASEPEDKALTYIFVHELLHYKQRDMFYKWFLQIVICLHWFNPFAYLLGKEINRACELSCDEAVISLFDDGARREYGDTLISFLKSDSLSKGSFASVPLTEGAKQLKERLGAIMNFKKKTKTIRILTGLLTLCIITGAAFSGIYPVAATANPNAASDNPQAAGQNNYKTGTYIYDENLGFGWYWNNGDSEDGQKQNNNNSVKGQDMNNVDSGNGRDLGDKSWDFDWDWDDEDWGFDWDWDDEDWGFDPDWDDEDWGFDPDWDDEDWDWDWDDKALLDAYAAYGIEKDGKSYYYQGELVKIIKDQRPDSSFYMLDINSEGTAAIKVIRNAEGEITGVSYMTEEEVEELSEKALGQIVEIPLVNTKEWDSSAFSTLEAYYKTDNVYILPSTTDKIILKEYSTENQSDYYARTEIKNNALIIRPGDRPAVSYSSYIEIYIPDAALDCVKIEMTSGNIMLDNFTGTVALSTVSGCIDVFDSSITGNINTTSGCIDICNSDMAGNINTVSGEIGLLPRTVSGDLYVNSHSGSISADFPSSICCNLTAKTVTGKLEGFYFFGKSRNKKEFSKAIGKDPKSTVTLKTISGFITICEIE